MNRFRFWQILSALLLLCLLSSCESSKHDHAEMAMADSAALAYNPDTVSTINPQPSLLIRKASISMKVKNIRSASDEIYRATARYRGSVWNSRWYSEESALLTKKVSRDSMLTINNFKQHHEIMVRVPREYLDSLLNTIDDEAEVLISKETSTENAGFEQLANDLKSKNYLSSSGRHLSAMEKKKSELHEYSEAEAYNNETTANIVDMQVSNLKLQDQSKYSTLEIVLTQDQNISKVMTYIPDPTQFDPPYYAEIGTAFLDGASFFSALLLLLIRIWPAYVIGLVGWKVYSIWKKKTAHL